jgi:hypothetical protein
MSGVSRLLNITALATVIAVLASAELLHAQTAEMPAPRQESPAGTPSPPQTPENCPGLVARDRPRVIPASFEVAALNADQVRITFVGHATFLIESPQLVRIATGKTMLHQNKLRSYTSTLAASACASMKTRRGSTLSPINSSKIVLASSISLTLTCSMVRALVSRVVSQSWLGFISPSPL